jgi:uncharacterized protein
MARETIYKRNIVDEIIGYLYTDDVVVLHGARQVGKTSILYYLKDILREKGDPTYYIDLEDSRFVRTLNEGVEQFIRLLREEGLKLDADRKSFVFVDEIQYLADPSSFLKYAADHYRNIKLIVSGSSSFAIKSKFKDSLAGRTVDFEIFPLSFGETLIFHGYHFGEERPLSQKKIDELKKLFREYLLYGGYPKITLTTERSKKERYLQQIIDTYVRKDIRDLAEVRDTDKFNKLLEALASQSGQALNISELSNTAHLSKQTVEKYLFIMEQTYILKLVRPFSGNVRSELFKLPKIFFFDTGIMQMLWLKGLQKEIIGNVFETGVMSELVKKYGKDALFYWRTKDGKEIDFILRRNNDIVPIEAKLNFDRFSATAIDYFRGHYKVDRHSVVGLEGRRKNPTFIYPWDI